MKIISTCLVLLVSGFAFSQFNRTFLHSNVSGLAANFTNYSYIDAQNKVNLITLASASGGQAHITKQRISAFGDLEAYEQQMYPVDVPGANQTNLLLAAVEQGNELYYVFGTGVSASFKLNWLKVNKNTGALISTLTSGADYRLAYFETKLVGNELVTYMVKNTGGLVRIALNIGTFTAPTEEVASASITAAATFSNTVSSGFKNGNLFVVNGVEKVVIGAGVTNAMIITRTAPNTYSTVNTGITTQRSVSSFLVNPINIAITNGINFEIYDQTGGMLLSNTFNGPANSIASQVEYVNNRFHVYYKYTNSNQGVFFLFDQNFQILDSVFTEKTIYHIHKNTNGFLIDGSDITKGLTIDLDGNPEVGRPAYCEFYKTMPRLAHDEYATPIQAGNTMKASIGLGTKVITSPNGLAGVFYDKRSACYNLTEKFVGFAGATEMVENAASNFNEQFSELPGPHTTSNLYDEVLESKYNRPYHVSKQMIEDHIDSLQSGSSNYIPVWAIRNWPAHGNTALGQAADLAPFVDVNSNGIYEPLLGDYPSIYGDDCVFSVTHYRDNGNTNKAMEIHSYVYTQACDTSDAFDNVLMRKVQVYSRGAELDELYFGGMFDGDLGNYNDDYIGTHVELGMIYNYNGDLMDEPNAGRPGFNDTLPAQGVMVLKGFKQANDGLDNEIGIMPPGESVNGYGYDDGIIDNEYRGLHTSAIFTGTNSPAGQSDPSNSQQLLNYLNGFWQFGDQVYYGGTGYPGAPCVTTIESNYMYPGDSDPLHFGTVGVDPGFTWSEFEPCGPSSTSNPAGDRRGIYSFGKTALGNGEMVELDYAYLINRQSAPATTIFGPVNDLFAKATVVRDAFMDNEGPCGINFDPIEENLSVEESVAEDLFSVYPNPTTGSIRINGISENGATIQVFDMNGKLLQTVSDYKTMQELDLSNLQGNLFILQITDGSKSSQKRVVKY